MKNISEINAFLDSKIGEKGEILKYLNNTLMKEFVSESQLVAQINYINGSQNLNIENYIGRVTVDE